MGLLRRMLLNVGFVCVLGTIVSGQQNSPMDSLELRGSPLVPTTVAPHKIDAGWEMGAPLNMAPIVKAKDGRTMMINGNRKMYSSDKGKTWSEAEFLPISVRHVIRLNSGKLGALSGNDFYTSDDDGDSWEKQGYYNVVGSAVGAGPYYNTLMQTRSGRLMLPVRWTGGSSRHRGTYDSDSSYGVLNGRLVALASHAHYPEPDNGLLLYSDDEGKTWKRSQGGIMVWHKDGYGGMWPCDEPSVIEASNGDVVLLFRTTLGRVYQALSRKLEFGTMAGDRVSLTPGQRFEHPEPTELSSSYSPCTVARLAETGDWLIIWNQASGDEMRAGYRRARLSSAISKDDGKTWEHFRTVDTAVVPPAGKVQPDPVPQMVRGFDYVGVLPADYGAVMYADVSVVDDTVYITYAKLVLNARPGDMSGLLMRVIPLSWFYEEEPPIDFSGPKLLLKVSTNDLRGTWNTFEVPADYYEGRFFCNLDDLAKHLRSPIGRLGYNMYAPLHQVITCLGWNPSYDRSKLDDPDDPRLIVTCRHPDTTEKRLHYLIEPAEGVTVIMPAERMPLGLYKVGVGTKKTLTFDLPVEPKDIKKIWLEVVADDIDEPKEAVVTLNGTTIIELNEDVMGESIGQHGRLTFPIEALVKGINTFEFAFVDNLKGTTEGFSIEDAVLMLETK